MSVRHFPSLDRLDYKLIEELQSDARQTYKNLAVKLGVSRYTIASRLQRLKDGGVIKIVCWTAPLVLGYKFITYMAVDAEPKLVKDVAQRLAARNEIAHVHLCTGRFNIFSSAWFRDNEDLSNFLLSEVGSIPGVLHIETMISLQEIKVFSKRLTQDKNPQNPENLVKDLDKLNLELIKELQADATQNTGQLARKLGVNQATISRRIQRLMDEHVVRIGIISNPFALGYECMATIGLKCNTDKVREVANTVATYNPVQYIGICAGRYDIMIWALFRKLADLQHFVTIELGNINGLKDTETMINYKLIKVSERLLS